MVWSLAPTYEKVASAFKSEGNVVIAKLDADKYRDLSERYGISGFPALIFFPKNNKDGEKYDYGHDLNHFVAFINEKCGTSRDVKCQLTSKAGIVESLENIGKEFVSAANEDKKAIFTRLEEEVTKLEGSAARHGKMYTKIAKSCMEKSGDYTKNESQRLERMLSKPKADELTLKKNILSAFA